MRRSSPSRYSQERSYAQNSTREVTGGCHGRPDPKRRTQEMPEAVIVATGRSPIGRATKGSLADVRPEDLLGNVMKEVVAKSGVEPADIDDVVTGSVGGAQINIARSAALLAGIPEDVPATTVNRYCSS